VNERGDSPWANGNAFVWIIALLWIAGCVSYLSRPYKPGPTQPLGDFDSLDSGPWPLR
jgi:hypothetical protein